MRSRGATALEQSIAEFFPLLVKPGSSVPNPGTKLTHATTRYHKNKLEQVVLVN